MKKKHSPQRVRKARGLCTRTLYLVDIENMVGGSELTRSDVAKTQHRIEAAVEPRTGDHTVIAASHHNALAMLFGWSGTAQHKLRSGQDGADTALLESVADLWWVKDRYPRVVVASGDNVFARTVADLKALGVEVLVVRPDRGFSPAMRLAAGPDVVSLGSAIPANVLNFLSLSKDAA